MGWDFTQGFKKKDVVADVTTERNGWKLLAKKVVGKNLWVVWNPPGEETPWIGVYILENKRGFGWGYKNLSECEHPFEYDCPEEFLELAPEACPEWREKVRYYNALQNRTLEVGATYELPGCRPDRITLTNLKPLRGEGPNGREYRVTKKRLGEKLEVACS